MTTKKKPQTISPRMLFRSFAIAEMFTWPSVPTLSKTPGQSGSVS